MKFKKIVKSLYIGFLRMLKRYGFADIVLMTGEVELEHWHKATGETTVEKLPLGLVNFNTVGNDLKYQIAQAIGASHDIYVGQQTLMTQASAAGKDGIVYNYDGATGYPTTTTKDSGGTGSVAWVKFKGVRTAAGAETFTTVGLGIVYDDGGPSFDYTYASQSVSKTLASGDVLTCYWTITIS
jgi:hypothetical protein